MKQPARVRPTVALLFLGVGALFAALAVVRFVGARGTPATEVAAVYRAPRPLPDFVLDTADGGHYARARLLGRYTFVFFGYTRCPDVCPATLVELAVVRQALGDLPAARRPAVLFVGVDPGRDAPADLGRYVRHFDGGFAAVGGDPAEVARLAAALGATAGVGSEANGAVTVSHSSALFLVDPHAALAAVFPAPHRAAAIAADYRRIIGREGG